MQEILSVQGITYNILWALSQPEVKILSLYQKVLQTVLLLHWKQL